MTLYYLLVGIVLLVFGKRLFWLFSGLVGFLVGFNLAEKLVPNLPPTTLIIIALVAGVVMAVFSILVQKLAIAVVGFLAGAFLVYQLLPVLSIYPGNLIWLIVILGGILGVFLATTMFDWALIIISSAIGASVIANHLAVPRPFPVVITIALLLFGIVVQSRMLGRD